MGLAFEEEPDLEAVGLTVDRMLSTAESRLRAARLYDADAETFLLVSTNIGGNGFSQGVEYYGSSQRSVQLRPVYMANKSSINSDLRGWRTPSVSGEELQTPRSPAHRRRRNREGPASSKGLNSQRGLGPAVEPRRK